MDTPAFVPRLDTANALVYAVNSRDVVLTMVDGRVLYRDGEYLTLDLQRAMAQCQERFARIAAEL